MLKRVLAIHDISCVGKCSLTVVLPIISAMSIEVSLLPTALLSTHTGGFKDYTFLDLTNEMELINNHFDNLNLHIDTIYSGYLGSIKQIDLVKKIRNNNLESLYVLDPVMGDNGRLYTNFNLEYVSKIKDLVKISDCLIPNLTEACYILDIPYKEDYSSSELIEICKKLTTLGPKKVVLTGVREDTKIGAIAYDLIKDKTDVEFTDYIPGYFHGTGDIFSSVVTGAITKDMSLKDAIRLALKFTYISILNTYNAKTDVKYGVNFEANLSILTNETN